MRDCEVTLSKSSRVVIIFIPHCSQRLVQSFIFYAIVFTVAQTKIFKSIFSPSGIFFIALILKCNAQYYSHLPCFFLTYEMSGIVITFNSYKFSVINMLLF